MKPILTALAGVMIAASVAASGFAQTQNNGRYRPPNRPPAGYQSPPRHAASGYNPAPPRPVYQRPPVQPAPPPPNSLGADWRLQQNEVRQGVTERRLVPLGSVIQQLGRRLGGRQLDAGLEYRGTRPIYRVRWITRDGRRVDMLIDAATGAVLGGG
jgi:hypothetical protein